MFKTAVIALTDLSEMDPLTSTYIYGSARMGRALLKAMGDRSGFRFKGFVDSKWDGEVAGWPVWSFVQFRSIYRSGDQVVIASGSTEEIRTLLSELRVPSVYDANTWYFCSRRAILAQEFTSLAALGVSAAAQSTAIEEVAQRLDRVGIVTLSELAEYVVTQGASSQKASMLNEVLYDASRLLGIELKGSEPPARVPDAIEVEMIFRLALQLDPMCSRASFCLGRLFQSRGVDEEAIRFYRAAAECSGALRPHAAFRIAQVMHKLRETRLTCTHYAEALALELALGQYRIDAAISLRDSGDYLGSLKQYSESLDRELYMGPEWFGA